MEKICFNLSALVHLNFEEQVSVSSRAGFHLVGPRDVNVRAYLSSGHSLEDARSLLDRYDLKSLEYNFFPDWIYTEESGLKSMVERFDMFCRTAVALGDNPIIIAPVSFEGKNDVLDYELARYNLTRLGEAARQYDARVAVEFLPWTGFDSAGKAWKIVNKTDMENVGIVLDSFHYFEGPSTEAELEMIPIDKIFLIHLNDMREIGGDLLTRTRESRVLPGEGHYRFEKIFRYLKRNDYQGVYSLEILNRDYQNRDSLEIAKKSRATMEKVLNDFL